MKKKVKHWNWKTKKKKYNTLWTKIVRRKQFSIFRNGQVLKIFLKRLLKVGI